MDAVIFALCVLAALGAEHIPALLAFMAAAGLLTIEKEFRIMEKFVGEFLSLVRQMNVAQQEAYLARLRKKVADIENAAQVLAHQDGVDQKAVGA